MVILIPSHGPTNPASGLLTVCGDLKLTPAPVGILRSPHVALLLETQAALTLHVSCVSTDTSAEWGPPQPLGCPQASPSHLDFVLLSVATGLRTPCFCFWYALTPPWSSRPEPGQGASDWFLGRSILPACGTPSVPHPGPALQLCT